MLHIRCRAKRLSVSVRKGLTLICLKLSDSDYKTFQYVGLVSSLLEHFYCEKGNSDFFRGNKPELETNKELLDRVTVAPSPGGLKYLILTTPGEGPETLGPEEALLDNSGAPKKFAAQ